MNREGRPRARHTARPTPRGRRASPATRDQRGSSQPPPGTTGSLFARLLCLAGLILSLASLAAVVGGLFTVHTVRVVGSRLPQATIVAATDVTGKNIFRVRSDQVVERLSHLPSIDVDRVEVSFPNQVTVYARDRVPVVAWVTPSGDFLIDRSGTQIGEVRNTSLPAVSGGDRPPDAGMVAAILYAATALPNTPNGTATGFQIDKYGNLLVLGRGGWQAQLGRGSAQQLVRRVAVLAAILDKSRTRTHRLTFVDVRYHSPYYTYAPS